MIPKIVIDTNIYISAIFWGGKPRAIVDLGRSGQVLIFTSSEIEECNGGQAFLIVVLHYPFRLKAVLGKNQITTIRKA